MMRPRNPARMRGQVSTVFDELLSGVKSYLAGFGQWVTVIQGVIFVACVLLFRRGVIGE